MTLKTVNLYYHTPIHTRLFALIALSFFLLTSSFSCFAEQHKLNLSLAVPPFPPFAYYHTPKKCTGVIAEFTNILSQKANLNLNLKKLPYPRIISSLHYGQLDSAFIFKNNRLMINNIVTDKVRYAGPFAFSKVIIVSTLNQPIKKYEDLTKLSNIAVIRKANFEQRFDLDRTINKAYIANYRQGLKMMMSGRVDAIIGSQIGLEHNMQMLNLHLEDYHSFQLSYKEWGLHYKTSALSEEQQNSLAALVDQYTDRNLLYNLYLTKLGMHMQCSLGPQ